MKKRQWSIRRSMIEVPDAQRRWDQAYQSLLQTHPLVWHPSPQESGSQEHSHEQCGLRPRFDESDKHKPRPSNNNSTAYKSIMNPRDGPGRKQTSFAMTATVEPNSADQVLIDCESKSG